MGNCILRSRLCLGKGTLGEASGSGWVMMLWWRWGCVGWAVLGVLCIGTVMTICVMLDMIRTAPDLCASGRMGRLAVCTAFMGC